ncbi:MAG: hypothetical protein ACTHK0_18940 [Ginsengibacter sp.]
MNIFFRIITISVFAFIGCKTKKQSKSAYDFLKSVSENVNTKCPMQIDSILKLENTLAFPVATFRYNLTLKYDTVKYDIHEFEKSLRVTTLNMVKTNPDGKMFKDLYTTLEYNFSDTLGNFLFRFVFRPEDYR